MEKYIGRTIEMVYMGRNNQITQRTVEVRGVRDGVVQAFCLVKRAPRAFLIANILAVQPVFKGAVS
ncbi:hypothetical protein SAMN02799630_00207 [Paenibacillus sp. UNCCL117]|uniref:hypothetical protein n=1 Tax=unclassified Paenibacillus TaxID=185978 RepID=UPI000880D8DC|nr:MULTISPECIES: hypothetical protein [unclassified Paenibacillus]SDC48467.1 hypothetical protein SAMN04488602_102325 [Paenibacillus sp. cl123]SFW11928.1 hypothetical protein SAMN02799630_00207 [Paenibacillus sp. UNCCL117]